MPDPVTGIIGGVSLLGTAVGAKSAGDASKAQTQAGNAAIAEQRAAREELRRLLNPYVQAGTPALQGMMDLIGLGGQGGVDWTAYAQSNPELMAAYQAQQSNNAGLPYGIGDNFINYMGGGQGGMQQPGAPMSLEQFAQQYYEQNGGDLSAFQRNPQADAIRQQEQNPLFQTLARQGEEAILQNASATGGLRGGNTQDALSRFRPQLLNQFINQQYDRLAGLTTLGQQSAAGVGTSGIQSASNIGNILGDIGAARAGGSLAQGNLISNALGGIGGVLARGLI